MPEDVLYRGSGFRNTKIEIPVKDKEIIWYAAPKSVHGRKHGHSID